MTPCKRSIERECFREQEHCARIFFDTLNLHWFRVVRKLHREKESSKNGVFYAPGISGRYWGRKAGREQCLSGPGSSVARAFRSGGRDRRNRHGSGNGRVG